MRFRKNGSIAAESNKLPANFVNLIADTDSKRLNTLINNINGLVASGGTPLCKTYKVARDYFVYNVGGYTAPKTKQCSQSSILYMSDGQPSGDIPSFNCINDAKLLNNKANKIKTYTIGFTQNIPLLQDMAKLGGGEYYLANSNDLAVKLQAAMDQIKNSSSTIEAPTTTSSNDQFSHGDEVYLSGFSASNKPRWKGNLRKYYMHNGKMFIDKNKTILARDKTGKLKTDIIKEGYGQDLLNYAKKNFNLRKIYVNDQKTLVNSPSQFQQLLNVNSAVQRWAYGDERSWIIGDILHSKPATIRYSDKDTRVVVGTNAGFLHMFKGDYSGKQNPESWAFYPKELTGKLLINLKNNIEKKGNTSDHPYGVDGSIFVYTKDGNKDGNLTNSIKDKAIVFFGLRRGGQHYYALNVINPDKPKLLWSYKLPDNAQSWSTPKITYLHNKSGKKTLSMIIAGGYDTNKDANSTQDLNGTNIYAIDAVTGKQLWRLTKNKPINGKLTHSMPATVSILDSDSDGITDRLYVGDTGGNIWRADIVPKDNGNNKKTVSSGNNPKEITLFKVAQLGGTNGNDRRVFNRIDVVRTFYNNRKVDFLLIGTGTRPNPKGTTVKNKFYAIMDFKVHTQLATASDIKDYPIKNSQLADMTNHQSQSNASYAVKKTTYTLDKQKNEIDRDVGGWFITLQKPGEKSWHSAVTFAGNVAFLTYTPSSFVQNNNKCSSSNTGESNLYAIDLRTARSVFRVNNNKFTPKGKTTLNKFDRSIHYGNGIPGKIAIHLRSNGGKQYASLFTPKGAIELPILGASGNNQNLDELRRRNNRSYILSGDVE